MTDKPISETMCGLCKCACHTEVEQLKKELECMKIESTAYDVGFFNGERRAMERVKEAMPFVKHDYLHSESMTFEEAMDLLMKKLGLDKEVRE